MVAVTKGASILQRFRRYSMPHDSARQAFSSFLNACGVVAGDRILLPSFIGWSAREGSGVYDPVSAQGLEPSFYRMDDHLQIDLDHLMETLRTRKPKVLVIIHYFGYVDPSASAAIRFAREHGVVVLEDEAHAMLTDLVRGGSGRLGEAAIFSLHKLLPVKSGGALVWNEGPPSSCRRESHTGGNETTDVLGDYDLWAISETRRENARRIHELIGSLGEHVEPLWGAPAKSEVPQTYPVVIRSLSRDDLYFKMNELGYGVTSLYHTLIPEITLEQFPESHALAKRIFNLPVHQDIEAGQVDAMIEALASLVGRD
jgi:dTDP-4-amino-4,6-dideoxygalactose transaminase